MEVGDEDVEMDNEKDEEEDFEDEAYVPAMRIALMWFSYSDDEDVSWKIRRAAAKLLSALIGTRNELLVDLYKIAAPTLVNRFSEREESVRLEVLAAFGALLKQTITVTAAEIASGGRNKRKRSEEMDDDSALDDRSFESTRANFS